MRLLAPDWRVHDISCSKDLQELVAARGIKGKLAANLRQLCAFDEIGDDRDERHTASGWYRIEDTRHVQFVQSFEKQLIVPVVGSVQEKFAIIQQHDSNIKASAFKDLLNGKRQTPLLGWTKVKGLPTAVVNLSNGDVLPSLISQVSSRTPQPTAPDWHRPILTTATLSSLFVFSHALAGLGAGSNRRTHYRRHRFRLQRLHLPCQVQRWLDRVCPTLPPPPSRRRTRHA